MFLFFLVRYVLGSWERLVKIAAGSLQPPIQHSRQKILKAESSNLLLPQDKLVYVKKSGFDGKKHAASIESKKAVDECGAVWQLHVLWVFSFGCGYVSLRVNNRALGPKYYEYYGIWALRPHYLGPWTPRVCFFLCSLGFQTYLISCVFAAPLPPSIVSLRVQGPK